MILADKIIQLRKRCGMSQDELAELINVSRQSVSKWEGALSVPDLDKILKMSEIFGVSTDYLLKDDIEENLTENTVSVDETPPLRRVSMEEANNFLKINNQSSFKTALGVALCIMSPVVPAMLDNSSGIITAISDTSMFIMVAVAVALFISASASKKSYNYLKKEGIKYVFYQDIFRLPDMKVVIKSTVETVCVVNGRLGNSDLFDSVFAPYLTE